MTNLVQFPRLGLSFHLNRVAFTIGGVSIYWYGVCIAVGLCLALVFAFRHSLEFGVDPDSMVDVILSGVVPGIISARAYYVAMAPFKYESIWEMIAIRDGGLATAASLAAFCSAVWPASGGACRCCPCSTLLLWVFSSGRAEAAGATFSIRRPLAATPPCRGVCTARPPALT